MVAMEAGPCRPVVLPCVQNRHFGRFAGRLGGPLGRHAAPGGVWLNGAMWLVLVGAVTWIVLMLRQLPCRQTVAGQTINTFVRMCYSDIPVLYQVRGQAQGQAVYLATDWEYPVLSGAKGLFDSHNFRTAEWGEN